MSLDEDHRNHVAYWLDNGRRVVGYNSVLLALGNITHFVLLQKDYELKSVAIIFNKGKVTGTSVFDLSPGEQQQ